MRNSIVKKIQNFILRFARRHRTVGIILFFTDVTNNCIVRKKVGEEQGDPDIIKCETRYNTSHIEIMMYL